MSRRPMSLRKRFAVLNRDGFVCQYCRRLLAPKELQVDHVVPVASGGGDEMSNLVAACFDCNSGKASHHLTPEFLTARMVWDVVEKFPWRGDLPQKLPFLFDYRQECTRRLVTLWNSAFFGGAERLLDFSQANAFESWEQWSKAARTYIAIDLYCCDSGDLSPASHGILFESFEMLRDYGVPGEIT